MTVVAQPIATVLTGLAALGAAGLALHNGNKTRENDRRNQEATRQHDKEQRKAAEKHAVALQEEAAKRDTERSLRDRFFKITETLSEGTNYVKREAGVYALVALADDWAVFHRNNPEAAQREQQTCLNVITGQLRDPLSITSPLAHAGLSPAGDAQHKKEQPQHDPALLTFKHRVQNITLERFRPSDGRDTGVWSHLDLDLSNCHLHEMSAGQIIVQGDARFDGAHFHSTARFDGAHFHSTAQFDGATFHAGFWFDRAHFHARASFDGAHFYPLAWFNNAHFHASASFNDTHFYALALFNGTHFYALAWFNNAHFHIRASFNNAHFHASAWFDGTHFHASTSFDSTHFCSTLTWGEAAVHESQIDFTDVRFKADEATVLRRNGAVAKLGQ